MHWVAPVCGHEWTQTLGSRITQDDACPVCDGRKIVAGVNDLATLHPEIAAQWHPTRNGNATAAGHAPYPTKVRWWLSPTCGHEWDAPVAARTRQNTGCAYCAGKRVLPGFNDTATTHPHVAEQWHPWLNGHRTPENTIAGTDKFTWWICPEGHTYDMKPDHRTRLGLGCPYCSGHRVLITFNDLATTHSELCKEWHPTKNTRTPTSVSAGSGVKVWWLCSKCGHEWDREVTSRANIPKGRARATGCPECKWSTWGTSRD